MSKIQKSVPNQKYLSINLREPVDLRFTRLSFSLMQGREGGGPCEWFGDKALYEKGGIVGWYRKGWYSGVV